VSQLEFELEFFLTQLSNQLLQRANPLLIDNIPETKDDLLSNEDGMEMKNHLNHNDVKKYLIEDHW